MFARLFRLLVRTAILAGVAYAVREVLMRRNEQRFGTGNTPYP